MPRSSALPPPIPKEDADATRARLIEAAGEVFAAQGFQSATVREICARAGANVAAVNYHFGDKTELYLEVVRQSICAAQEEHAAMFRSGDAEGALRSMIHVMLRRIALNAPKPAWHFRIMAHEIVAPTPAFTRVVEEVIGPNYQRLREMVGRIAGLAPNHEKARFAAHSIIGQAMFYAHARPVIERLWPGFEMNEQMADRIADHIADFSLCSLAALRRSAQPATRARSGGARRRSK